MHIAARSAPDRLTRTPASQETPSAAAGEARRGPAETFFDKPTSASPNSKANCRLARALALSKMKKKKRSAQLGESTRRLNETARLTRRLTESDNTR